MSARSGTYQVIAIFRVRQVCAEVRLLSLVAALLAFIVACVLAARELYWLAGIAGGAVCLALGAMGAAEYLSRWTESK